MLDNILKTSVQVQRKIYGPFGNLVIDVYDSRKSNSENVDNMTRKIEEIGPSKVSHHSMTDEEYAKKNTIDISSKKLSSVNGFINALKTQHPNIYIIDERKQNSCIHIEIPQP